MGLGLGPRLTLPGWRISRACLPHWPSIQSRRQQAYNRQLTVYGYEQAKALVYPKFGEAASVLSLHTYSISPPHSTLLTLRFLASPIHPADYNQLQGVYPAKPQFGTHLGTRQAVAVGGNEGVAEVIAVGDQVRGLDKGDWVLMRKPGFGTWRTYAQTRADELIKVNNKQGITPVQAGTVSVNPCTAYRMLKDFVALQPGDWYIQNGANSAVGLAAIQLAKAWGYRSINIIRDREPQALAELKRRLTELGADHVLTDAELQTSGIADRIGSWTRGAPIRLGLNCVGGKPAVAMMKHLAPAGHLVTYGAMSRQPVILPASLLIFNNITFHGFWVSRWSEQNPDEKARMVNELLDLCRYGKLQCGPVLEVHWDWDTPEKSLVDAVESTLSGFRSGKGVFVFGQT